MLTNIIIYQQSRKKCRLKTQDTKFHVIDLVHLTIGELKLGIMKQFKSDEEDMRETAG